MKQICGALCLCPKFLSEGEELHNWQKECKIPSMLCLLCENGVRGIDTQK